VVEFLLTILVQPRSEAILSEFVRCPLSHCTVRAGNMSSVGWSLSEVLTATDYMLTVVIRPLGNGSVVERINQQLLIRIQHGRKGSISILSLHGVAMRVWFEGALTLTRLGANGRNQD